MHAMKTNGVLRMNMNELEPMLTTAEVAAITRLTTQHLHRLRMQGKGPRYIRVSEHAVRYRRSDVQAYLEARLSPAYRAVIGTDD